MKTKTDRKSKPRKAGAASKAKRKSPTDAHPKQTKPDLLSGLSDPLPEDTSEWKSQIHHGDCIAGMKNLPAGSVDLVFADPPFNIGYEYDVYDDRLEHEQYVQWCNQWISAVYDVLKPDGAFWLAIGDEYAAELKLESQKIGFHCRSWVVWYYTFGVNCKNKFTRSHAHLFYFVKDKTKFTFDSEHLDNRVPSARELVYNDKRAAANGRLPDDTWIMRPADMRGELSADELETWQPTANESFVLRPQEVGDSFSAAEDTWYIPRVAGTFKERAGFHGCQMPEQLLGRIIRVCSAPGEIVIDPFSGSATTLAVAKKLGRQFSGFDLSEEYVAHGRERLASIQVGDPLDGTPEPMKSTFKLKSKAEKSKRSATQRGVADSELTQQRYDEIQMELTCRGVVESFRLTHGGYSADRVVTDPDLNAAFVGACERIGLVGNARIWNMLLFRLRKSGKLAEIETTERTKVSWQDIDPYLFAAEIAWQKLLDEGQAKSLDEIFCDPELAKKFDAIASQFAPGFNSLDYRWAALKLRKEARIARSRAAVLSTPQLSELIAIADLSDKPVSKLDGLRGVYLLSESKSKRLYAGETFDLGGRLSLIQKQIAHWKAESEKILVQHSVIDENSAGHLAWQSCLVQKSKQRPRLNTFELAATSAS